MKKVTYILLLVLIAVFGTLMLQRTRESGVPNNRPITGLPWQIEVHPDKSSTVFGITLGRDTLGHARKILGDDNEIAIIAKNNEPGSLEAYYSRYTAGILSGRLILVVETTPDTLRKLRENAHKGFTGSGAYKYQLRKEDLPLADKAKISTITFIPQANFDDEIILKRFGKPAEKIKNKPTLTHYLYPEKGLDLILDSDGKEVLQYIAPREFDRLLTPLREGKQTQGSN